MPSESTLTECDEHPLPPRARASTALTVVGVEAALAQGLDPYWPTEDWQTQEPGMLGFDPVKLGAALDHAPPETNTQALLVVRRRYIAAERYRAESGATGQYVSYSMAKSFVSALLGIAIDRGKIASVDEKLGAGGTRSRSGASEVEAQHRRRFGTKLVPLTRVGLAQ